MSNWNTSNVTDMSYMFENCDNLTHIKLDNFTTTEMTSSSDYSHFVPNVSTLTIDYKSSQWNPEIPVAFPNVNWNNIG